MSEALILPFVVDSKELELSRLEVENGKYSFRGHIMEKVPVYLPEKYALEVNGTQIQQVALLREPGEPVDFQPARLYELFKAAQ